MSRQSNPPSIVTLHRYFMWCNMMRTSFDKLQKQTGGLTEWWWEDIPNNYRLLMYLSYWYGGLYVVIEGWRQLKLRDSIIDRLLASPNVRLLKLYRHAIYHFQPEYFSDKMQAIMTTKTGPVLWVRQLTQEFSRYFIEWFRANTKPKSEAPAGS